MKTLLYGTDRICEDFMKIYGRLMSYGKNNINREIWTNNEDKTNVWQYMEKKWWYRRKKREEKMKICGRKKNINNNEEMVKSWKIANNVEESICNKPNMIWMTAVSYEEIWMKAKSQTVNRGSNNNNEDYEDMCNV